ncbi:hypothetical protein TNCV_3239731 [Trichonephila clavipes]|nr:hypothetical protein TNCV_3239731 [Trichonephila clavipes]
MLIQEPFNRPRYMWKCAILHPNNVIECIPPTQLRPDVVVGHSAPLNKHLDALEPDRETCEVPSARACVDR